MCRREGWHAMALSPGANTGMPFWIEDARMRELMIPEVTRANGENIEFMKLIECNRRLTTTECRCGATLVCRRH